MFESTIRGHTYGQLNRYYVPPEARATAVTLQRRLCLFSFDSLFYAGDRSRTPTTRQGQPKSGFKSGAL